MKCTANLKQLSLALLNYHDVQHIFPPATQVFYQWEAPANTTDYRANWVILVLPFVEEQTTYDSFDFTQAISQGTRNQIARGTVLPVMLCPTDVGGDVPFAGVPANNEGSNWARGNYAANGPNAYMGGTCVPFTPSSPPPEIRPPAPTMAARLTNPSAGPNPWRGVMGSCTAMCISKITDGTSHVMLLGEVRIGLNQFDRRGIWAMGDAGASSLYLTVSTPTTLAPMPAS